MNCVMSLNWLNSHKPARLECFEKIHKSNYMTSIGWGVINVVGVAALIQFKDSILDLPTNVEALNTGIKDANGETHALPITRHKHKKKQDKHPFKQ